MCICTSSAVRGGPSILGKYETTVCAHAHGGYSIYNAHRGWPRANISALAPVGGQLADNLIFLFSPKLIHSQADSCPKSFRLSGKCPTTVFESIQVFSGVSSRVPVWSGYCLCERIEHKQPYSLDPSSTFQDRHNVVSMLCQCCDDLEKWRRVLVSIVNWV